MATISEYKHNKHYCISLIDCLVVIYNQFKFLNTQKKKKKKQNTIGAVGKPHEISLIDYSLLYIKTKDSSVREIRKELYS